MDKAEKVMLGILLIVLIGCFVALITIPSCSELGGESKFSHYQYVSNGITTTLIPIYDCEIKDQPK